MRSTDTVLGLIRTRGKKGLPMERVMRLMYDPNLYAARRSKCAAKRVVVILSEVKTTGEMVSPPGHQG
jgi:hypothetical protein